VLLGIFCNEGRLQRKPCEKWNDHLWKPDFFFFLMDNKEMASSPTGTSPRNCPEPLAYDPL
jgi:hypothetical protein